MKYVLIKPNKEADVVFFKGVADVGEFQNDIATGYLSDAHVFDYNEDQMQYILDKMIILQLYSAIPIQDVDIFKAKLAGK